MANEFVSREAALDSVQRGGTECPFCHSGLIEGGP